MNQRDMAILLAEGENVKAQALHAYLNEPRASSESRNVLWRMYFGHLETTKRYLEIAKADKPKGDLTPVQQIIDECDLVRAVLDGYVPSIARNDALRATARIKNHLKSFL